MRFATAASAWLFCLAGAAGEHTVPMTEWNPCGPNALYVCARLAGMQVGRDEVIRLCQVGPDGGSSAANLVRAARALGFHHAVAVQTSVDDLSRLRVPAIVQDNQQDPPHFLAVVGQRSGEFLVFNPSQAHFWLEKRKAAQGWNGYAVLLATTPIPGLEPKAVSWAQRVIPLAVGLIAGATLGWTGAFLVRQVRADRRPIVEHRV